MNLCRLLQSRWGRKTRWQTNVHQRQQAGPSCHVFLVRRGERGGAEVKPHAYGEGTFHITRHIRPYMPRCAGPQSNLREWRRQDDSLRTRTGQSQRCGRWVWRQTGRLSCRKKEGGRRNQAYAFRKYSRQLNNSVHTHTWRCFQQLPQWNSASWLPHDSSLDRQRPGHTPNTHPPQKDYWLLITLALL